MVPTGTGMNSVDLDAGRIHYRESGSGPTIVFAHGLLVNGTLWRKVTPLLEDRFRCVVPDLPLGSHSKPMSADADLTPPGLARILADVIAALDLQPIHARGGREAAAIRSPHLDRVGARGPLLQAPLCGAARSRDPERAPRANRGLADLRLRGPTRAAG